MRVDIWADVVCPWCYIGFVRLDAAVAEYEAATGETVEVFHHAYQLDRSASLEPVSAVSTLGEKYGVPDEAAIEMMQRVSDIAAESGLCYRLAETKHANTRLAHRLVAAAAELGLSHSLLARLFNAYFEKAETIFSAEDLRPHAHAVGMSDEQIDEVLAGSAFEDVVDYDYQLAEQLGVRGVPFFVFDQKIGVAGAESVEVLKSAMTQAAAS